MKVRKANAGTGHPADSYKQRKQQVLSWLLHQVCGAQGTISAGWNRQQLVPPAVEVRRSKVLGQLKLMEKELRYELRNIK